MVSGASMRRSSLVTLILAFAFLVSAGVFYWQASSAVTPRITNNEAKRIIDRGRRALERKDTGEIINMMTPDAKISGRSVSEVEGYMEAAMRQVHGNLSIVARNIEA